MLFSTLDELIVTWTIISRLNAGDKLSIQYNNLSIDKASVFTPIRRAFRGDNRDSLMSFLPILINKTLDLVPDIDKLDHPSRRALLGGVQGILSLRETYNSDITLISRLEYYISKLGGIILKSKHSQSMVGRDFFSLSESSLSPPSSQSFQTQQHQHTKSKK